MSPPPGKHWQYPPRVLDEFDARGEIYWSPNGNPRRKVYLDTSAGIGVQDIWLEYRDAHNQNVRVTGYPTEKNPDLLRRIIGASSNPGDLFLDCYAGCGTTLAVANDLGRHWIGIDSSPTAVAASIERFLVGVKPMGDYVAKSRDERVESGRTPDLFDLPPVNGDARTPEPSGPPITEFSFLAERPLAAEYRGRLDRCCQQLEAAASSRRASG